MRNSLAMMWRERAVLVVLLLLVHHTCATMEDQQHVCPPSSCGKITNINYPFRFKGDPEKCGDKRYELGCENNVTVLYLYSAKYHVQSINYNNYTVRVVDPSLQHHNLSSLPLRFLSRSNFSDTYTFSFYHLDPYQAGLKAYENLEFLTFQHIVFMNCKDSVREKGKYVESGEWVKWEGKGYAYAIVGDLKAEDLEVGCEIKLVAPTSLSTFDYHSYTSMHTALAYGFEISWIQRASLEIHRGPHLSTPALPSPTLWATLRVGFLYLSGKSGRMATWAPLHALNLWEHLHGPRFTHATSLGILTLMGSRPNRILHLTAPSQPHAWSFRDQGHSLPAGALLITGRVVHTPMSEVSHPGR